MLFAPAVHRAGNDFALACGGLGVNFNSEDYEATCEVGN
jgi:hypothetical protein